MESNSSKQPWLRRYHDYLQERFPYVNTVLFLVLWLTAYSYSHFLGHKASPIPLGLPAIGGFLALTAFFYKLRVFDEHKDYALDLENHPQRVLQSGRITLAHLRATAIVGMGIEVAVSLWFSLYTLYWYIGALIFSLLMFKEFFVGSWLKPRLFLYAVTHMLIMPLLIAWVASMATQPLNTGVIYLTILSFCSGFAFEIARKVRAPEQEDPNILTYTQIFGTRGAPLAISLFLAATLPLMYLMLLPLEVHWAFFAIIALCYLLGVLPMLAFARKPTIKGAKGVEAASSLYMLAAYLVVLSATWLQTGITWNW